MNTTKKTGRESGSAYIIALLVLVVLSLLGMTLALSSETESLIGSSERTISRVFYDADSGLNAQLARALAESDCTSRKGDIDDPASAGVFNLRTELTLSPFVRVRDAPCNLCDVSTGAEAERTPDQTNATFFVMSKAEKVGDSGSDKVTLGRAVVAATVSVLPSLATENSGAKCQAKGFVQDPSDPLLVPCGGSFADVVNGEVCTTETNSGTL